jgi:hypothetical protein
MALYIHEENQQILWRLFDKLPYIINNPRKHVLPNHKETIFKETIEYFYERNKTKRLYPFELEQLNKETLIFINEHLVKTFHIPQEPTTSPPPIQPTNYSSLSKPAIASLATEYIPYKDKPNTQNPFSETIGDEPISNMEELIEMYKKQRTADEPVASPDV